jgi:hypothetical protein
MVSRAKVGNAEPAKSRFLGRFFRMTQPNVISTEGRNLWFQGFFSLRAWRPFGFAQARLGALKIFEVLSSKTSDIERRTSNKF